MKWTKHGTQVQPEDLNKTKTIRKAVPVSPELQKAIELFKRTYPDTKFSDTDVIKTMIEAGFKQWFIDIQSEQEPEEDLTV